MTTPDPVRLEKIKRPQGLFWYDFTDLGDDEHGTWLHGAVGSAWGTPHALGALDHAAVFLIAAGRPWATWWEAPRGRRFAHVDVCLPAERTPAGWRFVDLELDPVRHEPDGRVEIEDEDEYAEAVHRGWMTADDAALARTVADERAAALRDPGAWYRRGWDLLDGL